MKTTQGQLSKSDLARYKFCFIVKSSNTRIVTPLCHFYPWFKTLSENCCLFVNFRAWRTEG